MGKSYGKNTRELLVDNARWLGRLALRVLQHR